MKDLPNWSFGQAVYNPATEDGDNMTGGPTDGYYQVQGTDGKEITSGRGATEEEALQVCKKNATTVADMFNNVIAHLCSELGEPDSPTLRNEVRRHIAIHKALKEVGGHHGLGGFTYR